MIDGGEIYPGGFYKLMRELERRRRPFLDVEAVLPTPDVDLAKLIQQPVPPTDKVPTDYPKYTALPKWVELQAEFEGQPELYRLHAMLIAISRRRDPPAQAMALFFRIWNETGADLARALPVRWLISTATTFADCGETGVQRALGMGLSTLFDLVKLHESERRLSGLASDLPFDRIPETDRPDMPFGIHPVSLRHGDLDRVMLARLWRLCEEDETIAPLGMRMLWIAMRDHRTVFGRVQKLKTERRKT